MEKLADKFRVDFLTREGLAQLTKHGMTMPRAVMRYLVQWLLSSREGALRKADEETTSIIYQSIFDEIIENGPTVKVLKLKYHFDNNTTNPETVRIKFENNLKARLSPLAEHICTYTTLGDDDYKSLLMKITLYVVASQQLFNTKNTHMMSEAKAALQSIFTTDDLKDFVTRKKHYRLEHVHEVGKIVCGILIFNKYTGIGGEGIRDVVSDALLAYRNTIESVRVNSIRCDRLILKGLECISSIIHINPTEGKIIYKLPKGVDLNDLRYFNKYNYLNLLHEIYLNRIRLPMKRAKVTISMCAEEISNALNQLEEVLKFRLAVPTELVVPHFVRLFQNWHRILTQLEYLVHMNKFNDELTEIVMDDYPFEDMVKTLSGPHISTVELSMPFDIAKPDDSFILTTRNRRASLFINPLQQFCALTMGLTGGLLVKSELTFGVLPLFQQVITFKRGDYCAFAQKHYYKFTTYFLMTAFENPEMCILFKIPQEFSPYKESPSSTQKNIELFSVEKVTNVGIQTEHCIPPATQAERNIHSWNIWDYRRRAIQLANLRKSMTTSSQTYLTYCRRDATIQTHHTVTSTHRCICSSSQLSRSVCQILDEKEKASPSDCPPEVRPPGEEK